MKYIIATLILLVCFQSDMNAQARRTAKHRKTSHRKHTRHRPSQKHVFYRTHNVKPEPAQSAYSGNNTPVNDGQKKNKNRNMNYNTGQPLPASNGR